MEVPCDNSDNFPVNFLGILYHPCATLFFISWKHIRALYCKSGIR